MNKLLIPNFSIRVSWRCDFISKTSKHSEIHRVRTQYDSSPWL